MLGSESNSILDFKSIKLEINAFPGLRSNILTHLMESPNKECNIPDAVKRINKLYPTRCAAIPPATWNCRIYMKTVKHAHLLNG